VQSPKGKALKAMVDQKAKVGLSYQLHQLSSIIHYPVTHLFFFYIIAQMAANYYKGKVYGNALANFQWVSVFGFFTHTHAEQFVILKNLACAWEKYLERDNESLRVALV
jgi:hypothetical protein